MADESNGSSESFLKTPEIKFTKLFINGNFVDSISGKTFGTIDPRTGEQIARIAEGDKEDADLAVKAARVAFNHGPWPHLSGSARRRIMMKYADLIDENTEELAALDTIDAGKLFSWGKAVDIPVATETLRYYAGAADKIHGETLKMSQELQAYTLREPVGVVGHIIPWNFPSIMFFTKAGIPDGVIKVITGFGHSAGAAISSHMDIDKVSFTGSTEVGRIVMEAAAKSNLKGVSLELGGKSPVIIFNDADLDKASDLALDGIMYNKGEICVAGSRVFVQERIYEELVKKLEDEAKTWVVGDPFDPIVHYGPQVDKTQFERILSYIEHGKREGATLLTGGKPCGQKGYYIEPTIFTDVKTIERANATKYGLAAGIVTNDLNLANTVSRSIRAGVIWINCYIAFDSDCPYGGFKMSGFGRDLGMDALDKYFQVKSVVTPIYNSPWL
ncbi:hypothetical protein ACSBR1_005715 [Camellia fascicularis]